VGQGLERADRQEGPADASGLVALPALYCVGTDLDGVTALKGWLQVIDLDSSRFRAARPEATVTLAVDLLVVPVVTGRKTLQRLVDGK
jgi:hypothetical protein